MTAGFILVTMSDVVLASAVKFLFVVFGLACLSLFQSTLTKIMFAAAVVCGTGPVPCSVAADDVEADRGALIAILVKDQLLEPITARAQAAGRWHD